MAKKTRNATLWFHLHSLHVMMVADGCKAVQDADLAAAAAMLGELKEECDATRMARKQARVDARQVRLPFEAGPAVGGPRSDVPDVDGEHVGCDEPPGVRGANVDGGDAVDSGAS